MFQLRYIGFGYQVKVGELKITPHRQRAHLKCDGLCGDCGPVKKRIELKLNPNYRKFIHEDLTV